MAKDYFDQFRRKKTDEPVKTIRDRGVTRGGAGRTSGVRKDDLADAKDKRKPQGVTSPIKDAAKDVKKQPTSKPKAPPADKLDTKTPVTTPKVEKNIKTKSPKLTEVTPRPKVTGKGTDMKSRNVVAKGPMGDRKLANVTRDQLKAAGLPTTEAGLTRYLNKYDELKRRPKPSDFKKDTKKTDRQIYKERGGKENPKEDPFRPKGAKDKKETKKKSDKRSKPPLLGADLGLLPYGPQGMKKGGMLKSKTASKKKISKPKVRGAGIARKGVRPVKFR
tara:strand:- start:525 stop:1352 length:828 start_codon:yes stop_codon:yes gene_type:complete